MGQRILNDMKLHLSELQLLSGKKTKADLLKGIYNRPDPGGNSHEIRGLDRFSQESNPYYHGDDSILYGTEAWKILQSWGEELKETIDSPLPEDNIRIIDNFNNLRPDYLFNFQHHRCLFTTEKEVISSKKIPSTFAYVNICIFSYLKSAFDDYFSQHEGRNITSYLNKRGRRREIKLGRKKYWVDEVPVIPMKKGELPRRKEWGIYGETLEDVKRALEIKYGEERVSAMLNLRTGALHNNFAYMSKFQKKKVVFDAQVGKKVSAEQYNRMKLKGEGKSYPDPRYGRLKIYTLLDTHTWLQLMEIFVKALSFRKELSALASRNELRFDDLLEITELIEQYWIFFYDYGNSPF